ncbi:MAG: hypothetical protein R3234_10390 [Thermoanaerobaculia bacterium]|nr:hypothetical protein [Thermoanaerobaculia bacterium]
MPVRISSVDYFHATVQEQPGGAYNLLSRLAQAGVNLLAFNAVPVGPEHTQLVLFPDDPDRFVDVAERTDLGISGPAHAFLIQGDDELGALARIHRQLLDAEVDVYASTGVTDGRGGFGYVVYVRDEDHEKAARALEV